eukprot:TRINITY_DN5823_c0_g1_i1.p1 TRINITY_DN5823_c0_g1~~TRINITY_DN5823_c0_g1_i1.p1  ORF type:complete len:510 (+),score=80.18 TRINITY_DN5823_c0_g1_i1:236-1765(+)
MAIGAIGGLIGAAFCNFALMVQPLRSRIFKLNSPTERRKYTRILEAVVLLLITVAIQFWLPSLWSCHDRPANSTLQAHAGQYDCGDGRYNKMALLLFDGQEGTIKSLFSTDDLGEFSYDSLAIFLVIVFFLTGTTFGAALPSGLFVPNIVMGCTYGRFIGMLVNDYVHDVNPGNYALIGAAAQLAGFSRMTISLTVIVVELTNEMTYLLPIMLTITMSQWVGNLFTVSMYDIVIYMRKIPYLPPLLPPQVDKLVAEDIMTPGENVVTFGTVVQVKEIIRKLVLGGSSAKSHNGYPVVQRYVSWAGEHKQLVVGTITRGQIVGLLQQRAWLKGTFIPKRNNEIISPRSLGRVDHAQVSVRFRRTGDPNRELEVDSPASPRSPSTPTDGLNTVVDLSVFECSKEFSHQELEELTAPDAKADGSALSVDLSEDELDEFLDLTMFMDASPITVYRRTPFRRLYRIFLQMGMRHMCVVAEDSSLLGLVTRKDLWKHAQICLTDSCLRLNMRSGF